MLRATALSKSFFSNKVLEDVDFDVRPGEVHALIGENGAGKSTLINILGGILRRDSGEIWFEDRPVNFTHPLEAMAAGISVVHQELSLAPNASVAENMFLRRETRNAFGLNDWRAMKREAAKVFARMGLDIDPSAPIGGMSVGMQQLVEVAKAISFDAKLLIMDEPTSSLSEKEIAELFKVIDDLRRQGMGIVFVSHKLSELFAIADRITVLRDGRLVATANRSSVSPDDLIRMMVGRPLADLYPDNASAPGEIMFSVNSLSRFGAVRDVTFDVRRGEILGLAGLVGAGRTEAMRALINADTRDSGRFRLNGEAIMIRTPQEALAHGIVYLSEDRKSSGLFLSYSIAENIGASTLDRYVGRLGLFQLSTLRKRSRDYIGRMDIRPPDERVPVIHLSGGNQQKVLVSKALDANPVLLIFDEPTRGVDVGAKALIHTRLRDLAEQGVGVVVVSSEMPEIIGLSDRIIVFRNGGVSATLENRERKVSQEEILFHAVHH